MTRLFALCAALALTACHERPVATLPPLVDVEAVTEAKPVPSEAILSDPAASDRYSAALESWGDGVSAAGKRLCRYFRDTGMKVDCGE